MNFEEMTHEQLTERRAAIAVECEADGADLDALEAEVRGINAELDTRAAKIAKQEEIRNAVKSGAGSVVATTIEERKDTKMEIEVRNTPAYINAFANYIKSGKDGECRSILSENGADFNAVPVPTMVGDIIHAAWGKLGLLNLVHKTYIKGNLRVGFEISSTPAAFHQEGTEAPAEETLALGIVNMVPGSMKKWITVSDEALDLSGEDFIRYIYEELAYRIGKAIEDKISDEVADLPGTAEPDSPSAVTIKTAPAVGTIAQAIGNVIGDDMTVVMNRATWAAFKAAQYAANYAVDVFEGLRVVFNDALPAYSDASSNDVYAIVGDFRKGVQANFPNGEEITIKVDNLSLAEKDLVKFVGREYVAVGAVCDKAFCLIAKP